jgi:hypothetical protein
MKVTEKLTASQVAKLMKQDAPKEIVIADGGGLYLQVGKGRAARSWLFKYAGADGKTKCFGLGSAWTYNLAEARERARAARQAIDAGRDLIQERQQQKAQRKAPPQSRPVKEVVAALSKAQMEAGAWSAKYEKAWRRTLENHAYPHLDEGEMLVDAIDTELVLAMLTRDRHGI